jgi:hypothetical protein
MRRGELWGKFEHSQLVLLRIRLQSRTLIAMESEVFFIILVSGS